MYFYHTILRPSRQGSFAGIAYAVNQIVDLVASGVDGIHLYTMNNAYVAGKISEAVSGIIGV